MPQIIFCSSERFSNMALLNLSDEQYFINMKKVSLNYQLPSYTCRSEGWLIITGLTAYVYDFYALVARNEQNRGTPLAYCIASEDNSDLVKTFLTAVKKSASTHGYVFCPR